MEGILVVEDQGDLAEVEVEEMMAIPQGHRHRMIIHPPGVGTNPLLLNRVGGQDFGPERWVARLWDMKWEDEIKEASSGQDHRAPDATTTTTRAKEVLDLPVSQVRPRALVLDRPGGVKTSSEYALVQDSV